MTFTTPSTAATGGTATAAIFNASITADQKAIASHAAMALISTVSNPTIIASTTAKWTGMSAICDSDDTMLDLVNQRIVFKQAGTYRVLASGGKSTGNAYTTFVKKNGTTTLMSINGFGIGFNPVLDWAFPFVVNDFIELWYTNPNAFNDSVLPNDFGGDGSTYYSLEAEWVAP